MTRLPFYTCNNNFLVGVESVSIDLYKQMLDSANCVYEDEWEYNVLYIKFPDYWAKLEIRTFNTKFVAETCVDGIHLRDFYVINNDTIIDIPEYSKQFSPVAEKFNKIVPPSILKKEFPEYDFKMEIKTNNRNNFTVNYTIGKAGKHIQMTTNCNKDKLPNLFLRIKSKIEEMEMV